MLEIDKKSVNYFDIFPPRHESDIMDNPLASGEHQDELDNAAAVHASDSIAETLSGARCPTLPPPAPVPHGHAISSAATYPRLHTRPKAIGGGGPPNGSGGVTGTGMSDHSNPGNNPCPGGGPPGSNGSGGAQPPEEAIQAGGNPGGTPGGSSTLPGSTPPQQSGGAGNPDGTPPTTPPGLPNSGTSIHGRLWTDPEKHCRGFHCHPTTRVAALWICSRSYAQEDAACAVAVLKEALTMCDNRNLHQITGSRIVRIQADGGGEFINQKVRDLCWEKNISRLLTALQSAWLGCSRSRFAECSNRQI